MLVWSWPRISRQNLTSTSADPGFGSAHPASTSEVTAAIPPVFTLADALASEQARANGTTAELPGTQPPLFTVDLPVPSRKRQHSAVLSKFKTWSGRE